MDDKGALIIANVEQANKIHSLRLQIVALQVRVDAAETRCEEIEEINKTLDELLEIYEDTIAKVLDGTF